MSQTLIVFSIGIFLSLITVVADIFIKNASLQEKFSGWRLLIVAALIYGSTAFGWFFLTRKAKLSTLGVLYSVIIVISLTLLSVFYYKEKISPMEIFGIALAISSLLILYRFA